MRAELSKDEVVGIRRAIQLVRRKLACDINDDPSWWRHAVFCVRFDLYTRPERCMRIDNDMNVREAVLDKRARFEACRNGPDSNDGPKCEE